MGYCAEMRNSVFFVSAENTGKVISKMKKHHYDFELDPEGNIIDISFVGDKIEDDLYAFKEIAPYVKEGSFIEMKGEDGAKWKWIFENGTCREVTAKFIWEE